MMLEAWSIFDLKPYENNPKLHTPGQIDKIAQSIKNFGWDQPIVVDKDGVIIKGHGRRLAAMQLGMDEVPVLVRSDLSDDQVRAARLADNRVALGEIDSELLARELSTLFKSSDYTFESLGFDPDEIKLEVSDDDLLPLDDIDLDGVGDSSDELATNREPKEANYSQAFQVVVECESEEDQETVYSMLSEKGYKCRVLSM